MSIIPKAALEIMYDNFASSYRACCEQSKEVKLVLEDLKDIEKKKVLNAAKSGWVTRMKLLDYRLAEQGEL
jgi:hypothetical protein